MAEKAKLGDCACPVCAKGAEVWTDKNSKPYIKCEHCGMMLRGMTRTVWDWCRSLVKAAPPAPKGKDPEPAPKAKKSLGFFNA